jgi:CRISPR-associated exonuclease Cas4
MLNYPALKRTEAVTLTPEDERPLAQMAAALRRLAARSTPPPRITRRRFCQACAFEELCYG